MTKKFQLALAGLFSVLAFQAPAHALVANLQTLDCQASNGVTLKTVKPVEGGLQIESRLGVFVRPFLAKMTVIGYDAPSTIALVENGATMYSLELELNPGLRVQKTKGQLVAHTGPMSYRLAAVTCELTVDFQN